MGVGDRLRELREQKGMSQGDIEKRTGLRRPYLSRVENGHTVPGVETLEKWARALEVPLYALFYYGASPAKPLVLPKAFPRGEPRKIARFMSRLAQCLRRMDNADRLLLLQLARRMASRNVFDRK